MAVPISLVRQKWTADGQVWDDRTYQAAVQMLRNQYGDQAVIDEPAPGQTAQAGPAGPEPQRISPLQVPLAGARNIGAGILGGLTADWTSGALPVKEYETGSGLGNYMTNRLGPGLGHAAGMVGSLAAMGPLGIGRQVVAPIGASLMRQAAARAIPVAQKFGLYEGARSFGEARREGADIGETILETAKGAGTGVALGAGFGALPMMPMRYGGEAAKGALAGSGLAAAQGGDLTDIGTAAAVWGALGAAHDIGSPGFLQGVRVFQGQGRPSSRPLTLEDIVKVSSTEAKVDAAKSAMFTDRPRQVDWALEGAPLGEPAVRTNPRAVSPQQMGEPTRPIDWNLDPRPPELTGQAGATIGRAIQAGPEYVSESLPLAEKPLGAAIKSAQESGGLMLPAGAKAGKPQAKATSGYGPPGLYPPPAGDVYAGAGPPSELVAKTWQKFRSRQREPKAAKPSRYEEATPYEGIQADLTLDAFMRTGDLNEMVNTRRATESPRQALARDKGEIALPEMPEQFKEAVKFLKLRGGDDKLVGHTVVPPTESFEAISGTPGNPASVAPKRVFMIAESARLNYELERVKNHNKLLKQIGLRRGSPADFAAKDIGEHIKTPQDVAAKPSELFQRPEIAEIVNKYGLTAKDAVKAIGYAQATRPLHDQFYNENNLVRAAHGRPLIPYREGYVTHMHDAVLNDELGLQNRPGAPTTNFTHPKELINPRALRRGEASKVSENIGMSGIVDAYIRATGKDIFYNEALPTMRAMANEFRAQGLKRSAQVVDEIVDDKFGLVPRAFELHPQGGAMLAARSAARNLGSRAIKNFLLGNLKFVPFTQGFGLGITPGMTSNSAAAKAWGLSLDARWRAAARKYAPVVQHKSAYSGKLAHTDVVAGGRAMSMTVKDQILSAGMEAQERFTTYYGTAAHYAHGRDEFGLRGRELWDYASSGGQKIAGYYNQFNKGRVFSSRDVNAWDPLQGFQAQQLANMMSRIGPAVGRVGWWNKGIDIQTPAGKETAIRAYRVGKMIFCMLATNEVLEMLGKNPIWDIPGSFVPGFNVAESDLPLPNIQGAAHYMIDAPQLGLEKDPDAAKRVLFKDSFGVGRSAFLPIQAASSAIGAASDIGERGFDVLTGQMDLEEAARDYVESGDWKKMRNFFLTYVNPHGGGVQAIRTWDALEMFANEGAVPGAYGEEKFYIEEGLDRWQAPLFGVTQTRAGRKYLREKER